MPPVNCEYEAHRPRHCAEHARPPRTHTGGVSALIAAAGGEFGIGARTIAKWRSTCPGGSPPCCRTSRRPGPARSPARARDRQGRADVIATPGHTPGSQATGPAVFYSQATPLFRGSTAVTILLGATAPVSLEHPQRLSCLKTLVLVYPVHGSGHDHRGGAAYRTHFCRGDWAALPAPAPRTVGSGFA